jgi:hypothetical protein
MIARSKTRPEPLAATEDAMASASSPPDLEARKPM